MLDWLPSVPYPVRQNGYWLPVTSTLNWCEEDYYATIYSAEIINTMTNLLFQALAIKGVLDCLRNDHDRIFLITFIGYFVVGTGSFLFHATLKYPMQLVDELAMIYTTCFMFFAIFTHTRSGLVQSAVAFFLISLAAFITGYYHYLQDPKFHQDCYGILTVTVLLRTIWVQEANIRPRFRKQGGIIPKKDFVDPRAGLPAAEQKRQDERDTYIVNTMWQMIFYGSSVFLGGFALWTIDNEFCGVLRGWRHQIGLPWGLLLEGHGWWHVMTGTGAYFFIVWGIWIRHCLNGKHDEYELYWPRTVTSFPTIVKRKAARQANGSAKKTS